MAEHDFTAELYYDGAWHLVEAREGGGSTISWGTTNPGVETDPAKVLTDLDNLSRWYSPRSIASPLHGKIGQNTPIRFTLDGGDPYVLDAAEWNPQRSADDQDAWTSIQAAGVLRRIGRGTSNIASAVTRAALGVAPANLLAYWPLEGNADAATQGTDSMYGREDVSVTWNDSSLLVGSLPLPKVISVDETYPKNGQGKLNGVVPSSGATSTTWTVACWFIAETTYTADYNSVNVIEWGALPAGSAGRAWEVAISSDFVLFANNGIFIQMDNSARAYLDSFDVFDGQPHHMAVTLVQSGSNINVALYVDGSLADTGSATGYTLRPVDLIKIGARPESDGAQNPNMWVGGIGVWDVELTSDEVAALYAAYDGYRGETAADRFTRLCLENGITPTVVGTAAESVPMGPQVPRTLLQEFHEIIRTDDAHIFETRGSTNALTMVCGHAKLNVEPSLTLSYDGDIIPGLRPVVGDVGLRNDVIAKDPQGVTRRVIQETGPRNVQAPEDDPQGVYRYDTKIDVNPSTPAGLADAAGWKVHQGTYDGTWYASVVVDLDAAPALITAVNALLPGALIALQDLPDDEALDTVHLLVLGFKDTVRAFRRTREIFCAPGEPYRVGVLAETTGDTDPFVGHLETDGTETMAAVAVGATSFPVRTLTGPIWTIDPDDFPLDVIVGGQRVSLASIASYLNSNPYFETNVSGWTPGGATFVRSTVQFHQGSASGLLTPDGVTGTPQLESELVPATAATLYLVSAWVRCAAARSVDLYIGFYDSSGALLSASGTTVALAANTWTYVEKTATSPALTTQVRMVLFEPSTPPASAILYVDEAFVVSAMQQVFNVRTAGYQVEYPIPAGADVIVQQPIILTQ